MCGVIDHNE